MRRLLVPMISLALAACSSTAGEPDRIDRSDLDLDVCVDGRVGVAALSPADPVDYLEHHTGFGGIDRAGERCAGATDAAACEEAFGNLSAPDPFYTRPGGGAPAPGEHLFFTRGDEVGAVGAAGLAAFVAPVDTAPEAAFLARVASLGDVDCASPAAVEVAGGWEVVVVRTEPCGGRVTELRVFVDGDAVTTIVEQAVTREGDDVICP